ncbi:MAG: adenylyltransferase/cytidyltransferase family protein [Bacteroidota bacterium]
MRDVVVSGSFDDLRSRQVRFLEEAAGFGSLHVYLWSDPVVKTLTGTEPKFPLQERKYFLEAIRYVDKVWTVEDVPNLNELPQLVGGTRGMWVVSEDEDSPVKRQFCTSHGMLYQVIETSLLKEFPPAGTATGRSYSNKRVLVTGCFDWFHSGHIRFFEETSSLGDLYVVVGHDENVRLLKGQGHPLFPEQERRYMVGAIRFVKQALVSTGSGWMDAEPEIEAIQPDMYVVNEDGDKPEKREFCKARGLEYVVLKRTPAAGLPRRESTHLRGF